MPNLPKPKLRRTTRRRELIAPAQAEPEKPRIEQIDAEGLRWVNIERPGPVERDWLEEHFDFHVLDLEDVLSRNQRPKIDEYADYLFIVLHFPVFDPAVGRLGTGELDLFVGPGFVVTIPNQPLQPVAYLFERCRAKEELREQLFARGLRADPRRHLVELLFEVLGHFLDDVGFVLWVQSRGGDAGADIGAPVGHVRRGVVRHIALRRRG